MSNNDFSLDPGKPCTMLAACPAYRPTPLLNLQLDGQSIQIKDETRRMGLGSFKALGGVYAVAQLIIDTIGTPSTFEELVSPASKEKASRLTFECASAGNHGLSVAAGAAIFGAKSRIHLSSQVPGAFADRLESIGANIVRSGETYEESIACAVENAKATGAIHLADGSWPGYIKPPLLVMEGYTVLAEELRNVFEASGNWPTDVFLQAGVGGLAASVATMIRHNWAKQPKIYVVEPDAAPCLQASHAAGQPVRVSGPVSNMGRLDCKEPSLIAFHLLESAQVEYLTISDAEAAHSCERLGAQGIATTPSGAAGYAGLLKCRLSRKNNPLVLATEGDPSTFPSTQ